MHAVLISYEETEHYIYRIGTRPNFIHGAPAALNLLDQQGNREATCFLFATARLPKITANTSSCWCEEVMVVGREGSWK